MIMEQRSRMSLRMAGLQILITVAILVRNINAEQCGADSTNPESCNANAGVDSTVFASTAVAQAPVVPGLSYTFYSQSCPNYLSIIQQAVSQGFQADPFQGAGIVRIMFHDCFVQGCDASILLAGSNSEQSASPNQSLRQGALQLLDQIKSQLEQACPNTVSCADIVTVASAEAIRQANGPTITVPVGRKDGFSSAASSVVSSSLPSPFVNASQNLGTFSAVGLDSTDMVALSGAHSLGQAHCSSFSARLNPQDPNLDATFAQTLNGVCSSGSASLQSLDSTPSSFDNAFFKQILSGDALLLSDSTLELNPSTLNVVRQYARSGSNFNSQFARSFVKMSQIGVLTGTSGNVRKTCTAIN